LLEQLRREVEQVSRIGISGDAYKGGFKVRVKAELDGRQYSIDAKIRKVKGRQMVVIERRGPRGGRVEGHYQGKKTYLEVLEDGSKQEISEDQIRYVQILPNGEEIEVNPLPRFDTLEFVKVIPRVEAEDYIYEGVYELFSTRDNLELWDLAEKLIERDEALVGLYSFGGFKAYTVIAYPVVKEVDGRKYFVFLAYFCSQKKELKAWMPTDARIEEPKRSRKRVRKGAKQVQLSLL